MKISIFCNKFQRFYFKKQMRTELDILVEQAFQNFNLRDHEIFEF